MKAEAAEEARRWEQEQEAERKRKDSMILSRDEKDKILQVCSVHPTSTQRNYIMQKFI